MKTDRQPGPARDKLLFTPGPLTTSQAVKLAMLRDLGSRDTEFIELVRAVREKILHVAGVSKEAGWETVLMQGSGTFGVEAVVGSSLPRGGKLLVAVNGAYGERIAEIARVLGIDTAIVRSPETRRPEVARVRETLAADRAISHVALVHCETTTGIVNPVAEIGRAARAANKIFIVDAMSSFAAIPLDLEAAGVDFLVSSANKCIEGVPGFSFTVCRREALEACENRARSLSLDLFGQWRGLESSGQFRFTPPTHAILAFARALDELDHEGGIDGRAARYRENHATLVAGMRALGFEELLAPQDQSYVITSFRYPRHPNFDFAELYRRLSERGLVIYPGKLSDADCFRIGTVGRIFPSDVEMLVAALGEVLVEMGVREKGAMERGRIQGRSAPGRPS